MFYTYDQNNSGGGFAVDLDAGISHFVIIEADSADEANLKARNIGIYFDGVAEGVDCPCCGDRWYHPWYDATDAPDVFGKHPSEHVDSFIKGRPHTFVHYADGRIESFSNPNL